MRVCYDSDFGVRLFRSSGNMAYQAKASVNGDLKCRKVVVGPGAVEKRNGAKELGVLLVIRRGGTCAH